MNHLLNYLVTSSLYLLGFYIFYIILLSSDTHYRISRFYLLSSIVISLVLPLIRVNIYSMPSHQGQNIQGIIGLGEAVINSGSNSSSIAPTNILVVTYISGLLLSLILFAFNIIKIFSIVRKKGSANGIVFTDNEAVRGFSALGFVFICSKLKEDEMSSILAHEKAHVNRLHYIDLLVVRLASAIMWFNPVIYLYERSLRAVHEYQADEVLINKGENPVSYRWLILSQVFNSRLITIQNGFSGKSLIKRRIIMMTKKKSGKLSALKVLMALPLLVLLFFALSCTSKDTYTAEMMDQSMTSNETSLQADAAAQEFDKYEIFVVVEDMPRFNGGDLNDFRDWVQRNVQYPKIAADNGIQGKVYIMFVIEPDGSVSNVSIMKGVDPALDQEAVKAVENSPKWEAGKQRGAPVRVRFAMTVNFQLQ